MITGELNNNSFYLGKEENPANCSDFLLKNSNASTLEDLCILESMDSRNLEQLKVGITLIKILENVNDCRSINKTFKIINSKLPVGGLYHGKFEEYNFRKKRI